MISHYHCRTLFRKPGDQSEPDILCTRTDVLFPAGFFREFAECPRRILWEDVQDISASYATDGTISALCLMMADSSVVAVNCSLFEHGDDGVLMMLEDVPKEKLSPDLLERVKAFRLSCVRGGLQRLANRSEKDARAVAAATELAQQGAGAPEIMKAIMGIHYPKDSDEESKD